jgi:GH15 family glucan-1,4-alpha-glucosidase
LIESRRYPPIGDYALIGDCHSAGLVSLDGSIDWCCIDRFDARPVFARVLDWDRGGHFRIAPNAPYRASRRYQQDSVVLETHFECEGGQLVLIDCFLIHDLPDEDGTVAQPHHQLFRLARCVAGEVDVMIDFSPRFDYGLTVPQLTVVGHGLVTVTGGADALLFESELEFEPVDSSICRGSVRLRAGEQKWTLLTYTLPHELRLRRCDPERVNEQLELTLRYWRGWSSRCTYQGPYREQVIRSALVLKALSNRPTGAMVAAPTTSLPEKVGGVRNWDYRYAWLRDSAFTLYALFTLGYREEAHAFVRWLQRTTAGRVADLQIVYGVGGERLLPEIELDWLEGYRGSRPVRIGNRAAGQFQLDVYGEVLDTAWLYHRGGGVIEPPFWDFLARVTDYVADRWMEPDDGIWEVRGPRRQFTYSKVMAWVAMDRALRLARALSLPLDRQRCLAVRDEIRQRIETEGVDPATGAFVGAFGSNAVDASTLLIPLVHFLPATDPRVLATMNRIERELCMDGLVYRYRDIDDSLPSGEATFLVCSFWLVDNLSASGQVERARNLFERLLGYTNDVGLLAEQLDPVSGDQLGNFPQAFSHMGVINSAIQIARAEAAAGKAVS